MDFSITLPVIFGVVHKTRIVVSTQDGA